MNRPFDFGPREGQDGAGRDIVYVRAVPVSSLPREVRDAADGRDRALTPCTRRRASGWRWCASATRPSCSRGRTTWRPSASTDPPARGPASSVAGLPLGRSRA